MAKLVVPGPILGSHTSLDDSGHRDRQTQKKTERQIETHREFTDAVYYISIVP